MNTTISATTYIQPEPSLSHCEKIASFLVAKAPSLAILCLRIGAFALSFFGQYGKEMADILRYKAEKIHVIHILHPRHNMVKRAPLLLLTHSKNLARIDVIAQEKDISAANNFRERVLSGQFQIPVEPECLVELKKARLKGAYGDGICFGASIWFIKQVLQACVSSEEALKEVASRFTEGFPEEAAGLQTLYQAFEPGKMRIKQVMEKVEAILEKKTDQASTCEELALLTVQIKKQRKAKMCDLHVQNNKIFAALAALQTDQNMNCNFHDLEHSAETDKRFCDLPEGAYQLWFRASKSNHTTALLKYPFGTYIFDPNKGLMKCTSSVPSQDLKSFLQSYRKEGPYYTEVYPYRLSQS